MTSPSLNNAVDIEVITADLTDNTQLEQVVQRLQNGPFIDILVNNAGAGLAGGFAETAMQQRAIEIENLSFINVVAR
ncbi:SDR family NAD(P)-dependent oxidoreductase [Pectobacterium aroidearum]|uniref:SDR family NAD(P)-dependent oxidoreductase n=1 Tax=Pectobacterium aroidearum TaxID=1201031 RepID=UPI0015F105C5|nr:SDR family NAD(P)-dependent oxidoreductase [Pectobacterium aroidearum]MBA5235427.1 SDR family NAD(P)-dependent oxidoreductase [Pectobacterium aroidearum]